MAKLVLHEFRKVNKTLGRNYWEFTALAPMNFINTHLVLINNYHFLKLHYTTGSTTIPSPVQLHTSPYHNQSPSPLFAFTRPAIHPLVNSPKTRSTPKTNKTPKSHLPRPQFYYTNPDFYCSQNPNSPPSKLPSITMIG